MNGNKANIYINKNPVKMICTLIVLEYFQVLAVPNVYYFY